MLYTLLVYIDIKKYTHIIANAYWRTNKEVALQLIILFWTIFVSLFSISFLIHLYHMIYSMPGVHIILSTSYIHEFEKWLYDDKKIWTRQVLHTILFLHMCVFICVYHDNHIKGIIIILLIWYEYNFVIYHHIN